jgi:uncharacterized protein
MAEVDFRALQRDFATHLRDPARHPAPPGIEERRLAIYRRLFINNVEDLLARSYPVLRKLHGEQGWSSLVRDFYREHGCHTPYFHRLADEFLEYLRDERGSRHGDFPFLAELADYERVELIVAYGAGDGDGCDGGPAAAGSGESVSRGADLSGADPEEDPVAGVPVLSRSARLLAYEYPVHRIGPAFVPDAPGETPTFLVVFRDRQWNTGFIELNPLSARILWHVENDTAPGAELIARVAAEFGLTPTPELVRSAEGLLRHWLARGVLAGARAV